MIDISTNNGYRTIRVHGPLDYFKLHIFSHKYMCGFKKGGRKGLDVKYWIFK
jgi:hypothetical protein